MTHLTDTTLKELQSHIERGGKLRDFKWPARKKRRNEESRAQQSVIAWWSMACRGFGVPECLLFAIPNGSKRDPVTGAILKREGCRKGAPDLMLTVTKFYNCPGLFLEMKTKDGRLSPDQIEMHEALKKQGYIVQVCRSSEEAINTIKEYLKSCSYQPTKNVCVY